MLPLILVSLLWAFSFGLIKGRLAGLDPVAVSVLRLALAALVFLPFLRPRALPRKDVLTLAAIGAVQFGVMYMLYTAAYSHLKAHEVALATILTPIYVALLDAAVENRTRWRHMIAALLAVVGAGVLIWQNRTSDTIITGFLIVQGANLCFAAGQVAYKRFRPTLPAAVNDAGIFFWPCLGAVAASASASVFLTDWTAFRPAAVQWGVLAYLGMLASGLGFFLWNYGTTRVNTGTLAVFNNAKVPLGVLCSLLFFNETPASIPRLLVSLALLVIAVLVAEWRRPVVMKKAGR
ncbi:MAG TPA: EamA family transporter [Rariglobus sp.]